MEEVVWGWKVMPNFQLADYGMFDPNSEWAKQAAAQVMQQQAAQQASPAETVQAPQAAPAVAVQQPAPQATPMPNNNGLAAKAANVLTPFTMGEQQFANIFKGLKSDYDVAKAANDVAGMQNAHTKAEAYADMAKRFGLDLDRIGRNDSADQLTARLDANRAAILNNISQMLTPQEYYQQQIRQNMANGMSRRRAEESALGALEAYEGRYMRTIGDALPLYGANGKGEMDAIGTVLANRMYQQSPQSVALYDQYLVNPHDLWKFDKNMEVQDKLYGQKVDFGQHQFDWTRQLNNDKFNMDKWITQYNGNMTLALQKMKQDFQKASADEQIALARDNPALYMLLHGYGANGNGFTKPESETLQQLENAYNKASQAVDTSKVREDERNAVKEANDLLENLRNQGKIDNDTYVTYYDRVAQLIRNSKEKWGKWGYPEKAPE